MATHHIYYLANTALAVDLSFRKSTWLVLSLIKTCSHLLMKHDICWPLQSCDEGNCMYALGLLWRRTELTADVTKRSDSVSGSAGRIQEVWLCLQVNSSIFREKWHPGLITKRETFLTGRVKAGWYRLNMLSYLRQTASADYLCPDWTVSKHFYTMVYQAHQKNKKNKCKKQPNSASQRKNWFHLFSTYFPPQTSDSPDQLRTQC